MGCTHSAPRVLNDTGSGYESPSVQRRQVSASRRLSRDSASFKELVPSKKHHGAGRVLRATLSSLLVADGLTATEGELQPGSRAASRRNLSQSLGGLVDNKSGALSLQVSRTLSTISNCHMTTGEGDTEGAILLEDEVEGVTIRLAKQIGKGGWWQSRMMHGPELKQAGIPSIHTDQF